MSLFGHMVTLPGPDGERPASPVPARPSTPWFRRLVVVLAALTALLMLRVLERDPVPERPRQTGNFGNEDIPRPAQIALNRAVADGMRQIRTDHGAWSQVTNVLVLGDAVIIGVNTRSVAVVERVCQQARRYIDSPNPYPNLRRLIIAWRGAPRPPAADAPPAACASSHPGPGWRFASSDHSAPG